MCTIPSSNLTEPAEVRETLVLVDQHAASERVLLEHLLTELCTPPHPASPADTFKSNTGCTSAVATTLLESALHFQISEADHQLFTTHAHHFARWGILYDVSKHTAEKPASQVRAPLTEHKLTVRTLPPGIAERCKLSPRLLIELLRTEVWSLVAAECAPKASPATARSETAGNWVSALGSCPNGLLEMLNSRACRSAVMFNDELSREECVKLLADLSECVFPFMCAHGRVSMVPLVEIGGQSEGAALGEGLGTAFGVGSRREESDGKKDEGFIGAWRRWRRREEAVEDVTVTNEP